jgi:S-adenosylmethionine:tRNA ribosyltransferase-isomerase
LREKYQSVFAKKTGSVAAPTASLHFTPDLLHRLAANGHSSVRVTLHVGLGTFAPVLPEHLAENRLHCEAYEIDGQEMLHYKNLRAEGREAIAVGSTATRAMETALKTGKNSGQTEIFIHPPYEFQAIDGLLTNFHLPGSSLMMLVQAFLEWKGSEKSLVQLYQIAIQEKMRFYSFGDGMLIV